LLLVCSENFFSRWVCLVLFGVLRIVWYSLLLLSSRGERLFRCW